MGKQEEARRMRQIVKLLRPERVNDLTIIEASETSWMALAVMENGRDRRFRCQGDKLYDEQLVGDARVA